MRRLTAAVAASLLPGLMVIAIAGLPVPAGAAEPYDAYADEACDGYFDPLLLERGSRCSGSRERSCPTVRHWTPRRVSRQLPACEGVAQAAHPLHAERIQSSYLALRPDHGAPRAIYLMLHWHRATAHEAVNYLHLQDLARSRGALVIVPDVPGNQWAQSGSRNINQHVAWVDAVLADAQRRYGTGNLPVYLVGLSNGAAMAMHYACARADRIDAVMPVALPMYRSDLAACSFSQSIGYVQVHGDSDRFVPYRGNLWFASAEQVYARMRRNMDCVDAGAKAARLESPLTPVDIRYGDGCVGGRRGYLLRVENAGHTWPDMETLSGRDRNPYGLIARNFDATLQGYDLLQLAAGR
ncbi:hypothetical protein D0B54_20785 [Solimonas sp. K1W22B-7]|uniref:alpha/beta hydrolase family esterase n=1 Tax=Solimonas sp. K1W22B-7 TaxID=2303331 RepID=UPI000E336EB1|nr:alpha/beta fold hydrolase [Solimonas sp. K1W22B-7]AXQ30965.1 hypothetical protein D0B54_20785 [Solimonas sp. K1W22B-7]